jgi:hypothetical protein
MRIITWVTVAFLIVNLQGHSQVAVNRNNSAPDPSAALDVNFSNKGFLPPRMDHIAMDSIPDPVTGLVVFCNDCAATGNGCLCVYLDSSWQRLPSDCLLPLAPVQGIHSVTTTQIIWNWSSDPGAAGYKWNTINSYATATDMGNNLSTTETGLACGTAYIRYIWSYSSCGPSNSRMIEQITAACPGYPLVTTEPVTNVELTTATGGGNVTSGEGYEVVTRGVCWNTSPYPTVSSSKTIDGGGLGSYTSNITGLSPNTFYYLRAYATNGLGTAYGAQATFTTPDFAVGLEYGGGIIFYMDLTGQHGLIAAMSDQGSTQWGCFGSSVTGTSPALGTGLANTIAIVNGCGTAGIAARLCYNLVLNGFDDWYLPSREELYYMYQAKDYLNLDTFSQYWSSSQSSPELAWTFHILIGWHFVEKKYVSLEVRAIRSF